MTEVNDLKVVFVGHVDHGKSTLIGRILYDTKSLPESKIQEIEKTSKELNKEFEFAFILDALKEERERGITIDTTQAFFKSDKRDYVIIDAPGHKEFLKNMITGSSQAEAAILIVDINEGIMEQTKRHCYLLKLIGLKQVCIVVNKIDIIDYSHEKFNNIRDGISELFKKLEIEYSYIIPISALKGDNIVNKSDRLSWYGGPTILSALDSFETLKIEEKPFVLPIQDIYDSDNDKVIVGRVEAGEANVNDEVLLLPQNDKYSIKKFLKFNEDNVEKINYEESVGAVLDKAGDFKRGNILTKKDNLQITDNLIATVFWMENVNYKVGDKIIFRCVTQEVPCSVKRIIKKFDPAFEEIVEQDADIIKKAEIAEVEIELDQKVVIDSFYDIPELGRFVFEMNGIPVAGGLII